MSTTKIKKKDLINSLFNNIGFPKVVCENIVIEIGPGLGALTQKILDKNPKKLIIIEKDFELYKKLLNKFDKKK